MAQKVEYRPGVHKTFDHQNQEEDQILKSLQLISLKGYDYINMLNSFHIIPSGSKS